MRIFAIMLCVGCTVPAAADPIAPIAPLPAPVARPPLPSPSGPALALEAALAQWQSRATEVTVIVHTPHARGSGVIVSREGAIVTAAHVVDREDEASVTVTLPDGTTVPATVSRRQDRHDLVLLQVAQPLATCAPVTDARADWVLCAGAVSVEHAEVESSIGLVVSPDDDARWIEASCAIGHGMSGGPALDARGSVVGALVRIGPTTSLARLSPHGSFLRGVACDAEPLALALPRASDRATALRALAHAASSPSAVFVRFETDHWGPDVRGVGGVVVAPGLVLTVTAPVLGWDASGAPTTPLAIEGHPEAHALHGESRGEVALIRFEGLTLPPIAIRSSLARGMIVTTSDAVGVVSLPDATPGYVQPTLDVGASHCGRHNAMVRAAHPSASLPHAFVHDAPARRGDLLVDAAGVPVGLAIGQQGGIGFALPLSDALALF